MSALVVLECDEISCKHNDDGYCDSSWVSLISQECLTYEYDSPKEDDD